MFSFCKLAYALRIVQILFLIVITFYYSDQVREECAAWLKNPAHHFKRNAEDSNSHRPFTMLFSCNFEREFEDKTKSEKE